MTFFFTCRDDKYRRHDFDPEYNRRERERNRLAEHKYRLMEQLTTAERQSHRLGAQLRVRQLKQEIAKVQKLIDNFYK